MNNNHPSLSLVIVVYEPELPEFLFLLNSIDTFYDLSSLNGIYVAAQARGTTFADSLFKTISEQLPRLSGKVRIVVQDDLIPERINADGWFIQQLLKLKISSIVQSEYSLALDCKNHFINNVSSSDFFSNGKPLYNITSERGKFQAGESSIMATSFINSFKEFGLDYKLYLDHALGSLTPFVFKRDLSARLIAHFEGKYLRNFVDLFIDRLGVAEFYLYTAFLHSQCSFELEVAQRGEWISGVVWESNYDDNEYLEWLLSLIASGQLKLFGLHKRVYGKLSPEIRSRIFELWDSKNLDYGANGFEDKILSRTSPALLTGT